MYISAKQLKSITLTLTHACIAVPWKTILRSPQFLQQGTHNYVAPLLSPLLGHVISEHYTMCPLVHVQELSVQWHVGRVLVRWRFVEHLEERLSSLLLRATLVYYVPHLHLHSVVCHYGGIIKMWGRFSTTWSLQLPVWVPLSHPIQQLAQCTSFFKWATNESYKSTYKEREWVTWLVMYMYCTYVYT